MAQNANRANTTRRIGHADPALSRSAILADFQARATLFNTEGDEHEGMMIALYPPAEVARQLAAIPGVETPVDEMHITLIYLGSVQKMTDEQIARVIWITTMWARSFHPIAAKVNGIGRFNNSEGSDGQDVIYAVVDSHEIDILRSLIADDLSGCGVVLRTDHGFNPHVTLAYIDAGAESPIKSVPTIEMTIDRLSLSVGDQRAHYPLGAIDEPRENRKMNDENQLLARLKDVYQSLRSVFGEVHVQRDVSLNGVAMQCMAAFERANAELGDSWDEYHFMQELYSTDDGSLYVISISGGRLFKWAVAVDHTTGAIELGSPAQVTQVFTSSSESRTIKVRKREDGRYEAFAVLSTAAMNKDGMIDSRTLFDDFVRSFRGDGSEYINIYHLGRDGTRIGELRTIFREDNCLIGYYVLDDNIVAQRVGETLSGESGAKWGGSIEFWTEEEPAIVRVADGIDAPVFRSGILLGYSIALVADGAAWGTKHLTVNRMNEANRKKISELLGGDADAMRMVEEWVDAANERTHQPGVVTHTAATDQNAKETVVHVTEEEAEDEARAMDDGTGNDPADVDEEVGVSVDLDEETMQWLLGRIASSEWGQSIETRIGDMLTQLADVQAILATITESQVVDDDDEEDGEDDDDEEMQIMNDRVDAAIESIALTSERIGQLEAQIRQIANREEAGAPATQRVIIKRPKAVTDRPTEKERVVAVNGAADTDPRLNWKPTGLF